MKKIFTLILFTCLVAGIHAQRYTTEMFTDVDVESDIVYGNNLEVLTGAPVPKDLTLDVYTPNGDDATDRPLIIFFHTGNFLPPIVNGQINGLKTDPYLVDLCQRMARRGYVVASASYRLGWNPITPDQDTRTETLINAAYRGVQDANTAVRYFRKSIAEDGNPYGINGDDVALWGLGTGGYITLGTSTLNEYDDVLLPKFINGDGTPMVIQQVSGDPQGINMAAINTPNHVDYSSAITMSVNMGGALGDTSWVDETDPALISFHVPTDPFAPYMTGDLIVPTTGDFVVEVSGSYDVQRKAAEFGINDAMNAGFYDDDFTAAAEDRNNGYSGLLPFPRPSWDLDGDPATPPSEESSPWDWWDEAFWSMQQPQQCIDNNVPLAACNWDLISRANNPDASFMKADAYMDSIVNYFVPRSCVLMDLPECADIFTSTKEVVLSADVMSVAPNPANEMFTVTSNDMMIEKITIFGMDGKLYQEKNDINATSATIYRNNLPTGIYFVRAHFEDGIAVQRVSLK